MIKHTHIPPLLLTGSKAMTEMFDIELGVGLTLRRVLASTIDNNQHHTFHYLLTYIDHLNQTDA